MFAWQLTVLFEISIFIFSIAYIRTFINGNNVSWVINGILLIVYIATLIAVPTIYNIQSYDSVYCEGSLGIFWYFVYGFEILTLLWVLIIGIKGYITNKQDYNKRRQITLMTTGLTLFLLAFSVSNIYGEITQNYEVNLVGPLGMVVFLGLVTYTIVRYKSFNMRLFGSQALVYSLWVLVLSLIFINKIDVVHVIVLITLVLLIILGIILIRSIKNEITQKERLQKISLELYDANEKLKGLDKLKTEFLSLASHQLRSPLTAIKGYTSMLLEGSFGEVTGVQKDTIDKVFQSSKHLAKVVEDLLNVTKIEQGGMVYQMAPFDMEKTAKEIVDDLRITAEKKGLVMDFKTDNQAPYTLNGDMEKLRQVFLNLIDNSIKYTKGGSISVILGKNKDKIRFSVTDTGMGMTEETKQSLFQKFARGEGGKVNAGGSGVGLYLAKEIVGAHKGKVWVESPGVGKGSTFIVEL